MKHLTHTSLDSYLGRICIDLDDFDWIVKLLRGHCRSVQIVAHDAMIDDSSQLEGLLKHGERVVKYLEIEAHNPFLRVEFYQGRRPERKGATGSEVVSDPDDALGQSLRLKIEVILEGTRRRGPRAIFAGFTDKEKRACRIAVLIVGLISALMLALIMFGPLVFPAARFQVTDAGVVTLSFTTLVAIMMMGIPCAPVLLLKRGRRTIRTQLEPKPEAITEL
jgi:hypothetical protein